MKKKMNKIKDYLTNPATWISFCVFLVGLGITRGTLTSRMDNLEKNMNEIDMIKIQTTLSQIQTDIERIKKTMQK